MIDTRVRIQSPWISSAADVPAAAPVPVPQDGSDIGNEARHPRREKLLAVGLGVVAGVGCLAGIQEAAPAPQAVPVVSCSVPSWTSNPVVRADAPDPGVIRVGGDYWMVATGRNAAGAFPMWHSTDLFHWNPAGDLFPNGQIPSWAKGSFWAPEIHRVGDRYVAYFTARDSQGMLRVGAATSANPNGPFTDIGHPLISNLGIGTIDPTFFRDDDGRQYLYWKEDGNGLKPQQPSRIMAVEVAADGIRPMGEPGEVLRNDPRSWEGAVVEAPEIVKHGDAYYLFYSGNGYATDRYAEGVARAASPLGPFEKRPSPILHSSEAWKGPGHAAVTDDGNGHTWLVYHAWERGHVDRAPGREVLVDPVTWGTDGWPHVAHDAPSTGFP